MGWNRLYFCMNMIINTGNRIWKINCDPEVSHILQLVCAYNEAKVLISICLTHTSCELVCNLKGRNELYWSTLKRSPAMTMLKNESHKKSSPDSLPLSIHTFVRTLICPHGLSMYSTDGARWLNKWTSGVGGVKHCWRIKQKPVKWLRSKSQFLLMWTQHSNLLLLLLPRQVNY